MTISVYHSDSACNCLVDPRLLLCAPYKATMFISRPKYSDTPANEENSFRNHIR